MRCAVVYVPADGGRIKLVKQGLAAGEIACPVLLGKILPEAMPQPAIGMCGCVMLQRRVSPDNADDAFRISRNRKRRRSAVFFCVFPGKKGDVPAIVGGQLTNPGEACFFSKLLQR
jgi:hypothetical protein